MSERTSYCLGEVTFSFDARRVPVRGSDRKPGPYPYYGASGIVDYVDSYLFDGNYLLVAEDGENLRTRKTPIAFMASDRFWVNNHAHILQANHHANTRFLCFAVNSLDISGYLSGSTQPKLTQSALNAITLRLPSRDVQDQVVEIVSALDNKIAVNERIVATSRELGMRHYERSVLAGHPIEIPVSELARMLTRGGAPSYTDGTAHPVVINQKCIRDGRVDLTPARRTLSGRIRADRFLEVGDVLVNSTGVGTLGRVGIWYHGVEATCDSHVTIVRIDPNRAPIVVAGYAMIAAQHAIEALAEGSTGQTELSRDKLGQLRLRLPGDAESERLAQTLTGLESRSQSALLENVQLVQLRDTLLPRLMSGELRIRDAERVVSDAV